MLKKQSIGILAAMLAWPLMGHAVSISLDQAECLPIEDNGVVTFRVSGEPAASAARVYFRRLHEEVEDFYYVVARPFGDGRYWAVLPKAEDEPLEVRTFRPANDGDQIEDGWAEWWREKERSEDRNPNGDLSDEVIQERASRGKAERRDWLEALDDQTLQTWLESLENEPTEYFATVNDAFGKRAARSDMKVVEVREECAVELTPQQEGEAENLTVGETAPWEDGEEVFHWLCDGVVTRIGVDGILRSDSSCRACVIAWWQKKEVLIPAVLVPPTIVITNKPPQPVSPSLP